MSLAASPMESPPFWNSIDSDSTDHQQQHSSSSTDRLKPSIIIITLVLAITVLLSISICLLLRHLNRRRLLRHLSITSAASDSRRVSTSTRRVSPQTPTTTTASLSVIDSLPLFTYSSITRRSTSGAGDCAVCLCKFEPQDQLRLLPLCCHAFHADCIDTWLESNLTCPLCRSPISASESDVLKAIHASSVVAGANDSFRLEIGSVSRRRQADVDQTQGRTYSIGSFDYVVEEESDITTSQTYRRSVSDKEEPESDLARTELASDVASGRNWLKDYVDRLSYSLSSSRTFSFRSSGWLFTGSSRRTDIAGAGEYDLEADYQLGEQISDLFRWLSGV